MEYFLSAASSNMLYHLRQNASGYYSEISLQKMHWNKKLVYNLYSEIQVSSCINKNCTQTRLPKLSHT